MCGSEVAWTQPAGCPYPTASLALPARTERLGPPQQVTSSIAMVAGHVPSESEYQETFLGSVSRRVPEERRHRSCSRARSRAGADLGWCGSWHRGHGFGGGRGLDSWRDFALPRRLGGRTLEGLETLSVFGSHLAPRISEGRHRLDQVGLETDTRSTVTSYAGLALSSARPWLSEARAAAGDGIGPLARGPRGQRWQGLGGKRSLLHHREERRPASERSTGPRADSGQEIL